MGNIRYSNEFDEYFFFFFFLFYIVEFFSYYILIEHDLIRVIMSFQKHRRIK